MKRYLSALLFVGLLCSMAQAGGTLVLTDAGYQVMTVGPNGAVLTPVVAVDKVVDLRTGVTPNPPDDPTPPTDLSPTALRVKDLATVVNDPAGAQALTVVYREVSKASANGKLNREQVMTALRMASDDVLNATKTSAKWVEFRASISKLITEKEAQGPVDYSAFCADVANGLEASSPQGVLTAELLQMIIQLVLAIISLFTGGGGGGV